MTEEENIKEARNLFYSLDFLNNRLNNTVQKKDKLNFLDVFGKIQVLIDRIRILLSKTPLGDLNDSERLVHLDHRHKYIRFNKAVNKMNGNIMNIIKENGLK